MQNNAMEKNRRVCKVCLKEHWRIKSGRWGKDTAWRDEHGILWNGRVCGACNRISLRERVAKARKKKQDATQQDG